METTIMETRNWDALSAEEFWQVADDLQDQTLAHAEDLFSFIETADPEHLVPILIQYRFFTIYYIPDLAILIARLRDGKLRTFLADILSDELGYGDALKAHPRLYDDFLHTVGVNGAELDSLALRANIELLDEARRDLMDPAKSSTYGIGLRGMGGECVCQIYLARLHEHLIKNPWIQQNRETIDWKFWDLHVGEHDIEHRLETRRLINDEIVAHSASGNGASRPDAGGLGDLGRGYYDSMVSWSTFWNNIFAAAKSAKAERTTVRAEADFRMAAAAVGSGS